MSSHGGSGPVPRNERLESWGASMFRGLVDALLDFVIDRAATPGGAPKHDDDYPEDDLTC